MHGSGILSQTPLIDEYASMAILNILPWTVPPTANTSRVEEVHSAVMDPLGVLGLGTIRIGTLDWGIRLQTSWGGIQITSDSLNER